MMPPVKNTLEICAPKSKQLPYEQKLDMNIVVIPFRVSYNAKKVRKRLKRSDLGNSYQDFPSGNSLSLALTLIK